MPHVSPLIFDILNPPGLHNICGEMWGRCANSKAYLICDPSCATLGGVTLDVRLNETMLNGICTPSFLEEGNVKLVDWHPPRFPDDMAKNMIFVLSLFPDQRSELSSPRNSACDSLVNVDMLDEVVVLVMFNSKSDGAVSNRHSRKPTDTL